MPIAHRAPQVRRDRLPTATFDRLCPDDNIAGVFAKYLNFHDEKINGKLFIVLVKLPLSVEQLLYTRDTRPSYFAEVFYFRDNLEAGDRNFHGIIEINTSDTSDFISLPGIGSKLAWRIVNFRDKLGGFYSINQIAETYGLPDSTFQKIKPYLKLTEPNVKKININTATVDELKVHPYIRYQLARPIVAYREEHGQFSKPEDLKKIMIVTDDVFLKMAPYLQVQ